jgi:tight adherence protein C
MVPVSPTLALALACGLALGLGLWSLLSLSPALRRPSIANRVAPYVRDVSSRARELTSRPTSDPLPVLGVMLAPAVGVLASLIDGLTGGSESTAQRLRQAGSNSSVAEFRTRQVVWGAAGAAIGAVVAIIGGEVSGTPLVFQAAIVVLGAAGGVVARDYVLQRQARARLARMNDELPTVLEFLTLSLSAGEGATEAIRRVSRISSGELAGELARVISETATGVPFADAINRAASQLQLPGFTRFVEQLTGALERGTPLAEVLRAQAQDAREGAKRDLIEAAGRKEVTMLVPLVFLILPTTIAFAVFPALLVLQVGL